MTLKPQFISVDEIGRILGLARPTVIAAIHRREIPSIRIGRQFRVPADFIEKRVAAAKPAPQA